MADGEKLTAGQAAKGFLGKHYHGILITIVPLILLPIYFQGGKEWKCLYIICVMAVFWITEALPLSLTSLLPVVYFPLVGILSTDRVCSNYFKETIIMFLAGLILALAIEYCNLHKRVALSVVLLVGCSPRRLFFGVVLVSVFVSMWISNAASTAMLCPIVRATLDEIESNNVMKVYGDIDEDGLRSPSRVAIAFFLATAYGTSIGGVGTLIGTGTNPTFQGLYDKRFPNAVEKIDFPLFIAYNAPFLIVATFGLFLCLSITHMGLFRPKSEIAQEIKRSGENDAPVRLVIKDKYKELGPISMHEIQVSVLFILMVVLLFTRHPSVILGWADVISDTHIGNALPILFCVLFCFLLPVNYMSWHHCCGGPPYTDNQSSTVLTWPYIMAKIPWGLLFLLGGGFALADASGACNLTKMLGNALSFLRTLPAPAVQLISIFVCIFMTNFSSNVAICNIVVPIVLEVAVTIRVHPLYLCFPSGVACSFAFFLPVGTPGNAIAGGYGNIKSKQMAEAAVLPTLMVILVLFLFCTTWHFVIYPNSDKFPDWALEEPTED